MKDDNKQKGRWQQFIDTYNRTGLARAVGQWNQRNLDTDIGTVLGKDVKVKDAIQAANFVNPAGSGLRIAKGVQMGVKAFKAAKAAKAARQASNAVATTAKTTTGTAKAATGTARVTTGAAKGTVRTTKLAGIAKKASGFSLPSMPSLRGLSKVTSAVRKAVKPEEEEELKKEAYQWLGITLLEKSAAWTRKAGKNPSGGLNAKGVASYRAKNPGSKLKTAVTTKPSKLKKGSKAAKRRSSFCSRMSGMRKRQNPKNNTGKDRLSLSLKKWNC